MQYFCTTPERIAANPTDPWEKQKAPNPGVAAESWAAYEHRQKPLTQGVSTCTVYVREEGSRDALRFEVRTEVEVWHDYGNGTPCAFPAYPAPQNPIPAEVTP